MGGRTTSQNGNDAQMRDRVVGRGIHTRQLEPLRVPDVEEEFSKEWLAAHLDRVTKAILNLGRLLQDRTKPVDEYQPVSTGEVTGTVTVQPQYDIIAERIESVLLWGPPAATGTLSLGDCDIPVVIPTSGVLVLGPLGLLLSRNDSRALTLTPTGNMGLRLMGWADVRF